MPIKNPWPINFQEDNKQDILNFSLNDQFINEWTEMQSVRWEQNELISLCTKTDLYILSHYLRELKTDDK